MWFLLVQNLRYIDIYIFFIMKFMQESFCYYITKLLISLTLVSNNIFGWLFSDKFLNYNINFYFFLQRYILILWLNYIIFHGYFEPGEENELELEEVLTTQLIYFSDDACLRKVPIYLWHVFCLFVFCFPFHVSYVLFTPRNMA